MESQQEEEVKVSVFTSGGQLLLVDHIKFPNDYGIDVSLWKQGLYIVQIKGEHSSWQGKFIR